MNNFVKTAVALFTSLVIVSCAGPGKPVARLTNGIAAPCAQTERHIDTNYSRQEAYVSADTNLNRLQEFFYPVLEANKKEFSGQASVKGFGAGSSYPQIWLRDSATIIPLSKYYYSLDYLASWIEEHLSYQKADGQLYDWIASGSASNFLGAAPHAKAVYQSKKGVADTITISADKNTTESDQESSAVDAAYQVFKITGDREWLNKKIQGRTLIDRLNLSLNYLLRDRFDSEHGLITSAFTADWGDVSPVYPDQRAIYRDEHTPVVASLYSSALFYRAAKQLEELNVAVANEKLASQWKASATLIKDNINKHLWQEDKGFYRIHLLLTPNLLPDPPDDSNLFAMGGNSLTILYGIADDSRAARIFKVAAQRQREYRLSTIAGVLLPPYPRGFFKHAATSEAYVYQNGGQWDWWAGRFLLAEFERGYSQQAYRQMAEIAKKSVDNNGLYEWHTRTGEGKGSRDYAGSAGALGGAVLQGLFGVYLSREALVLKIRLGYQTGQIHLYQPVTDQYVAYQHCYEKQTNTIRLGYSSNLPDHGKIHILMPSNQRASELSLDGSKINFETEVIGEDTYVVVDTDWKPHLLQVKLSD
ncbi:MAG: hypothetical protein M3R69_02000 [Acidobacteriota bacterium]|nr:hypothetical protein [Acidobacteriota bacterium]